MVSPFFSVDRYEVSLTLTRAMLATNPADPAVHDTFIIERARKLITGERDKVNKEINKFLDALDIPAAKQKKEVHLIAEKVAQIMGAPLSPEQEALLLAGKLEEFRETVAELDYKGTTVFFWNDELQRPMISTHMVYGFLKGAAEAIGRTLPRKAKHVLHSTAYTQSLINQHVTCDQEFVTFDTDLVRGSDGKPVFLQRSLRAETAQGPRISLAKSEQVPAGSSLKFVLVVMRGQKGVPEHEQITEDVLRALFDYGQIKGLGQWRNSDRGRFKYTLTKLAD